MRGDSTNPIDVRVFTVTERSVPRSVQAVGSLFPLEESVVSSQVEGRVEKVLSDVGDRVGQGQVLVTLDPVELRYELDRQRAAVLQVRARLGLGPADPLPRDPSQVASVQRAAADMFDAEQKFRRAEQLYKEKLISQQQLDEASSRYKGARATHDLALQEVEQLKAQLQSSETAVRLAEKKLADASIRAPFPGSIKQRRVSAGEFVRVQSPIAVVVRTDTLRARLAVPEKWAGVVKTGAPVEVHVEAFPNEAFHGKVSRINPAVAQETRTFEVEALIPNGDNRLKPGFFIQATIPSDLTEKVLMVPERAVSYRYGIYKVFVLKDSKVEEREIQAGARKDAQMEILKGLAAGERVAMAVKGELFSGAVVKEAPAKEAKE
ncbi:MAG TPA: efflux RND transporter periplasmic adaptor subunit [Candidatus Acidoferrales bacterium]|nr:efflux RND transporter periplasmic adaptor subunit [Candidatus Acidoferrales bacterium]